MKRFLALNSHRLLCSGACAAVVLVLGTCAAADILSPKRGIADVGANFDLLQATNSSWYYNWGPGKSSIGRHDAKFVPMIWGGFQANQGTINSIINYGDVEWVLGFNEPERPDQANMSVAQAISAWRTLSDGFRNTGIKLASPGVADTGGPDGGQAWLASFMSQVNADPNLYVDAVAFHWYGVSTPNDPIGAANSFISRVDSYHNQYGLPVWITEFAIHDWGGNYTDEEVRAANAIFLDNVIPRLESRSHVAGYSWYNWFGDSRLVEGNPLTPTNVGVPYVGTLRGGDTYDFGAVDHGHRVAYLAGGELTHGPGAPGTIRYINALSGTSNISGTQDWGLTRNNWVRVQPGATLRKASTNQVTWAGAFVTNNGTIEVAEGTLRLEEFTTVSGTGAIRVAPGGTFDVSGLANTFTLANGQSLVNDSNNTVIGDVVVGSGATVSGTGTFANTITALSGSTIRVGRAGLSRPNQVLIDDFESYPLGDIGATPNSTGDVWTGVFNGTANADIVSPSRGKALSVHGTNSGDSWRGAIADLANNFADDASLPHGEVGTYFFRVRRTGTANIDTIFGLTDLAATTSTAPGNDISSPWNEYAVLLSIVGTSTNSVLRAYSEGSGDVNLIPVATNEWINVWLTVDNAAKTYRVATSTGTADGSDSGGVYQFGRRTGNTVGANPLRTFGIHEARNVPAELDDLYFLEGFDLTNPLGNPNPGMTYHPATLTVEGDLTLNPGATLELDIHSPAIHDRLVVMSHFTAAGSLNVMLDESAPPPEAGDAYDLFDFSSASGAFALLNLPELAPGLSWNTSALLSDGVLSVVAGLAGDYNQDGIVNTADYVMWRNVQGTDFALPNRDPNLEGNVGQADYDYWVANFGSTLAASSNVTVPEPGTGLIMVIGVISLAGAGCARRRWRS